MKKKHLNILINLLIVLISIYIIRVLKLIGFCCLILSILSPLFFGYVISWIIDPVVNKLKINRIVATTIVYLLFLSIIILVIINIFPLIIEQCKKIFPIIKYYVLHNNILFNLYENLNIQKLLSSTFKGVNDCFNNIVGGMVNLIYSFIFGFYFLISKNKNYFSFIPNRLRKGINRDLRLYIKSLFFDTLFIFGLLSLLFLIFGLPYSLLFALFCSITNIVPYIGPYIGGIPAVLIGLSVNVKLGIVVLVSIVIVQLLENIIIQPLLVSKNVNLNPILILISVIVFSHFLGIVGMIISTPIVIILKNIILFYKKNKPKWFISVLGKL